MKAILSKAHNWVQKSDRQVICTRCDVVTDIGNWDIPRCTPHYEAADSGYKDEA